LLKILKTCTDSKATSYKVKFAVESMLRGVDPDQIGLGQSVRRVMKYRTIKNKFGSIHPDLEREGYTGVKVTDTGLLFLRSNQGWLFIVRNKAELMTNILFQCGMKRILLRKLSMMENPLMTIRKSPPAAVANDLGKVTCATF
jgi:hypothetical protein